MGLSERKVFFVGALSVRLIGHFLVCGRTRALALFLTPRAGLLKAYKPGCRPYNSMYNSMYGL